MNFSDNTDTDTEAYTVLNLADAGAVLAREAGVPFRRPMGNDSGDRPHSRVVEPDGGRSNALPCLARA